MIIETERLLLREMTEDDFPALYKVLADSVLLKLQEIISTFGRIQKMLNLGWAFFIISWRTTMIALRASYDARFASSYEMLRIAMSGFAALKV